MAVIAIPVGAADVFGKAFHSAFRALTFSSPDAIAREPFFALASKVDGWGKPEAAFDQVLINRGLLHLGDAPLAERLHDAIVAIEAQRLKAQYEHREVTRDDAPRAGDTIPPIVIVPVVRVASVEDESRLAEVAQAVEAALEPFTTRLVRREISTASFVYAPWIHLEPPLSNQPPNPALFLGPQHIRGGKCVPILHVSTGVTRWDEKGRLRLIADLLALYGFSRRRDAAAWLAPSAWAEVEAFHTFTTSFVELPLTRARRKKLFEQLYDHLHPGDQTFTANLTPKAEEALRDLVELINSNDVSSDDFGTKERPLGTAIKLGPEDRWSLAEIEGMRRADRLHTDTVGDVRRAVSQRISAIVGQKLQAFRQKLNEKESLLKEQIATELRTPESVGVAIASTMRFCDLLVMQLPKPVPDTGGDADKILRKAIDLRRGWISSEENRWQEGSGMPTRLAVALSALMIFIGATAIGYFLFDWLRRAQEWHPAVAYAVALVIGGAAAALYFRGREAEVRAYLESWRGVEESFRRALRTIVTDLVALANHRVRSSKIATLPALERSIHAVKTRLHTERQGILALMRNELDASGDEEPARPGDGWFRLPVEVVKPELTSEAREKIRALMVPVIELATWPRPIEIDQHQDALDNVVTLGAVSEEADLAAAGNLIRAAVEYASDPRVGHDFDDDRTFTSQRAPSLHAFAAPALREHVLAAMPKGTGAGDVEELVPDLVVVANVRSHRVLRREEEELVDFTDEDEVTEQES